MTEFISFASYMRGLVPLNILPCADEHPDFGQFSEWKTVSDAMSMDVESTDKYKLSAFCGVYLVAAFPDGQVPSGRADPFAADQLPYVVYVGRTRTQPLSSRWQQLESALKGHGGHSGGNTLAKAFAASLRGDQADSRPLHSRIRLAGLPVWVSKAEQEPGAGPMSRRQTCFRTAAIEALLIEAVSERKRLAALPPIANEPGLMLPDEGFAFIIEERLD